MLPTDRHHRHLKPPPTMWGELWKADGVIAEEPHHCQRRCHTGACGPCSGVTEVECRCGSQTTELPCAEVVAIKSRGDSEAAFTCDRRCNKKMSCGRHKCGQYCCVGADHQCRLICGCEYGVSCTLGFSMSFEIQKIETCFKYVIAKI